MNKIQWRRNITVFCTTLLVVLLFENLVIPSVSSTSSNYYVSITGNDITGDGSLTHPWRTIQKAANMVLAGDTVYVRGGTYFEEVRIQDKHGTNDSWITFMPYNNEVVIVDGRNIQTSWGHAIFRTTNASYIRITGFKLYNSARVGVWINTHANYIRIDNNEIYNCSGNGIYTETYELYTITNIFFENNSVDYVNNNWSGYGGTSSEGVSFRTVQYFTINNNRISRCGKECIDVKQGSAYGTVHHNMIDTSSVPGGFNEDYNHVGIYCDGMSNRNHDIDIYNNYIYGSHGPGIVIGVEEPTGSLDNVCVYNNIVNITWVSGAGIGIVNWGEIGGEPISDVFIYGNTVKTKSHPALSIGATNIQNIVVKNNIFTTEGYFTLSVWSYPQNATVLTLSHNLFYRFGGVAHNRWMDGEDLSWGDNSQIKDPFFTPNFRVMNGSPAVDNGSVVPVSFDFDENDRPQGNGYDIGAYEFLIISPVWDINEDGICDIYDLVCISNHFGEIGVPGWIREDADNNGEVQVLDLVSVSNHYGASW